MLQLYRLSERAFTGQSKQVLSEYLVISHGFSAADASHCSTQCLTRVSPEDKAEFHARLFEARGLLRERDLPQDTFVFNVSFNVVYTNETREGGFVP